MSQITLHTLCDLQCGGELRETRVEEGKKESNQIVTIRDESLLKGEVSKVGRKGGIWLVTHAQGIDSQSLSSPLLSSLLTRLLTEQHSTT